MPKISKNKSLFIILTVAFVLRLPGFFWGELYKDHLVVLEPDEFQHIGLSILFLQKIDGSMFPGYQYDGRNTLGFSTQLAIASYPLLKFFGQEVKPLLLTGRALSIIYGLLLVILLYKLVLLFTNQTSTALLAAALMAIFDLSTTYSHYAVPEIAYIFWVYFTLYQTILFYIKLQTGEAKPFKNWCFMVFGMGITLALKYDFIPVLILVILTIVLLINKHISWKKALGISTGSIMAVLLFYMLSVGFQAGWNETIQSIEWLRNENYNQIPLDNHLLHNPVLYLAGTVVGIGVPATILSAFGLKSLIKKTPVFRVNPLTILILFLAFEFFLLWKLDAPFVRRCLIFLPFLAVAGGIGAGNFLNQEKPWARPVLVVALVYTFALTACSQWNFVEDPRYAAREFLRQDSIKDKKIFHDRYSLVRGMPKTANMHEAEYLVTHEPLYSRYWKSFTTPFKIPRCCDEVYHCDYQECRFYQKLLQGGKEYELLKKFEPLDWAPERQLYKRYFGSYETFLGDVLIFRKTTGEAIGFRSRQYPNGPVFLHRQAE